MHISSNCSHALEKFLFRPSLTTHAWSLQYKNIQGTKLLCLSWFNANPQTFSRELCVEQYNLYFWWGCTTKLFFLEHQRIEVILMLCIIQYFRCAIHSNKNISMNICNSSKVLGFLKQILILCLCLSLNSAIKGFIMKM